MQWDLNSERNGFLRLQAHFSRSLILSIRNFSFSVVMHHLAFEQKKKKRQGNINDYKMHYLSYEDSSILSNIIIKILYTSYVKSFLSKLCQNQVPLGLNVWSLSVLPVTIILNPATMLSVVTQLVYPAWILHSGDSPAALPVLLVPPTPYLQGFLTAFSSLLPPPVLPFVHIKYPSTLKKNNKNSTCYSLLHSSLQGKHKAADND